VARQPDAVHLLRENVRQRAHDERRILAHLRAGDVGVAVDWYAGHGRLRVAPTRTEVLADLVDAWYADRSTGADAAMFAWRRANVAELNRLARQRWAADGHLTGPELNVPGDRSYAAGDRVVLLAPAADGRLVTSQTGVVVAVDPAVAALDLRMDDGQQVRLPVAEAGADRLDYGYARTVHRSQGDTVDVSHRLFDGGGRELAYVSMSRARQHAFVYAVADDVDQAKGDLAQGWSNDRRQRWALDTGTPTTSVTEIEHAPEAPSRLQAVIREARLRAERDAIAAAIPPDVNHELRDARRQLATLEARRHDLETGGPAYSHSPEGRAGAAVQKLATRIETAQRRVDDPQVSRSRRHTSRYVVRDLTPQFGDAVEHWKAVASPEHARLTGEVDKLSEIIDTLREQQEHRVDWLQHHPEALRRLDRLDQELDGYRPPAPQRAVQRVAGYDPPSRFVEPEIRGPDLGLSL
jgi:hypothetical protein